MLIAGTTRTCLALLVLLNNKDMLLDVNNSNIIKSVNQYPFSCNHFNKVVG